MGLLDYLETPKVANKLLGMLREKAPEVYGSLGGLLGTAPDQFEGSVLDPATARVRSGAEAGFPVGTALQIAPLLNAILGRAASLPKQTGMGQRGGVDVGKKFKYPQDEALETARKNAVKMLGLPENNTAMDRARALGFDMKAAHYSRHGVDVSELDSGKFAIAPFDAVGTHIGPETQALSRFNNTTGYKVGNPSYANDPLKGVTYPVTIKRGRQMLSSEGQPISETPLSMRLSESADYGNLRESNQLLRDKVFSQFDSIPYVNEVESPGQISYIVPPKNIRSRFAAFDPARINENNLLAGSLPFMFLGDENNNGLLRFLENVKP